MTWTSPVSKTGTHERNNRRDPVPTQTPTELGEVRRTHCVSSETVRGSTLTRARKPTALSPNRPVMVVGVEGDEQGTGDLRGLSQTHSGAHRPPGTPETTPIRTVHRTRHDRGHSTDDTQSCHRARTPPTCTQRGEPRPKRTPQDTHDSHRRTPHVSTSTSNPAWDSRPALLGSQSSSRRHGSTIRTSTVDLDEGDKRVDPAHAGVTTYGSEPHSSYFSHSDFCLHISLEKEGLRYLNYSSTDDKPFLTGRNTDKGRRETSGRCLTSATIRLGVHPDGTSTENGRLGV